MLPGLNPKKMQAMMRQMGIAQEDVPATRVIIETKDRKIMIANPSVVKITMQGQTNYQISGEENEIQNESPVDTTEEDIKTIIEQTECSEEEAKEALKKARGDLTEAILSLS
jgi:nascent polypeptide-associated complex subunit alpha